MAKSAPTGIGRLVIAGLLAYTASGSSLPQSGTLPILDRPGTYNQVPVKVIGFCGVQCVMLRIGDGHFPSSYNGVLSRMEGKATINVNYNSTNLIGDIHD